MPTGWHRHLIAKSKIMLDFAPSPRAQQGDTTLAPERYHVSRASPPSIWRIFVVNIMPKKRGEEGARMISYAVLRSSLASSPAVVARAGVAVYHAVRSQEEYDGSVPYG